MQLLHCITLVGLAEFSAKIILEQIRK